jgi:hypothetical protein
MAPGIGALNAKFAMQAGWQLLVHALRIAEIPFSAHA